MESSVEVREFLEEWDPFPGIVMPSDWGPTTRAMRPSSLQEFSLQMLGPGVYLLIKREVVVYVGSSQRLARRVTEHLYAKKDRMVFDKVRVILCSEKVLKAAEKAAVLRYKPLFTRGTGHGREKFTLAEVGIDLAKLIAENPAVVQLKATKRSPWRRV